HAPGGGSHRRPGELSRLLQHQAERSRRECWPVQRQQPTLARLQVQYPLEAGEHPAAVAKLRQRLVRPGRPCRGPRHARLLRFGCGGVYPPRRRDGRHPLVSSRLIRDLAGGTRHGLGRGDEVALDAGCGSGRVTRLLLDRLPCGRVYGVDQSPAMLAVAAEQLASYGDRVRLIQGDLVTLQLPEPVDAIFSNATFHWITDHDRLLRNLYRLLAPGGVLVAQCGGAGNIDRVMACANAAMARSPFRERATPAVQTWRFADAGETRALL